MLLSSLKFATLGQRHDGELPDRAPTLGGSTRDLRGAAAEVPEGLGEARNSEVPPIWGRLL